MLIKKSFLKQIILEEINHFLNENSPDPREAKNGLYVKMSPQKFLQFASTGAPCSQRVKMFKKKTYDDTGLLGTPSLRIHLDKNIILSHEGRGRACLAIENNLPKITVYLSFWKGEPLRSVISNWENIKKRVFIFDEENKKVVQLDDIELVKDLPDWPRALKIYAVKYIDKTSENKETVVKDYLNRLIIDIYLENPQKYEPLQVYRLKPNKTSNSNEPPYELDKNGNIIIKDSNVENESIWEKVPQNEWSDLPVHRALTAK